MPNHSSLRWGNSPHRYNGTMKDAPKTQTPTLRQFLGKVKTWSVGAKMWPHEISEVQYNIAQARTEIIPNLSAINRPAFELVLRRAQRYTDKSIANIVDTFKSNGTPGKEGSGILPYISQPLYATQSWPIVKPWVLEKSGPQGLYDFAQSIRLVALREALCLFPEKDVVSDIYETLTDLQTKVEVLDTGKLNPLNDWADLVLGRDLDFEYEQEVFEHLQNIIFRADMPTDEGRGVLVRVAKKTTSGHPTVVNDALSRIDIFLSSGVPWEDVFEHLPLPTQEHIKLHPVYRRSKMMEIADQNSAPRDPPRPIL